MDPESGIDAQDCIHLIETSKSQVTVIMTLKNFSEVCRNPDVVFKSPVFNFSNATWKVLVCPNSWKTYEPEGRIILFLRRISSMVAVNKLSLTVGFRDKFHDIIRERTVEIQFQNTTSAGVRTNVDLEDVIEGNVAEILLEDSLTVYCNIKDVDEEAEDSIQISEGEHVLCSLDALCRDYENLYSTGDYSDVTLRTNKEEISAHRAVLGTRSEAFSNMFKHNSPSNIYDIVDVDSETLRNLLFYIYTGKVRELTSDNVTRLFAAADKFAMDELKLICKRYMKRNLSVANVCDVVILSEKYDQKDLSSLAKRFLNDHAAEVVESKEWSYFEVEFPELALTLLRSFVRNYKTGEENKSAVTEENSDPLQNKIKKPAPEEPMDSDKPIIWWICVVMILMSICICYCFKK